MSCPPVGSDEIKVSVREVGQRGPRLPGLGFGPRQDSGDQGSYRMTSIFTSPDTSTSSLSRPFLPLSNPSEDRLRNRFPNETLRPPVSTRRYLSIQERVESTVERERTRVGYTTSDLICRR